MSRSSLEGKRQLLAPLALSLAFFGAAAGTASADDWPQWLGPKRDAVWRENGIVEKLPDKKDLKYVWRMKIGGGYADPAVAGGKVFITDRILAKGATNPANPFGRSEVPGKERVLCLDEKTGNILWKHEYDCSYQISYPAGPRCTPVVEGDRVYTLGAMGDLFCFHVKDGSVLWSKNLRKEYHIDAPLWGFAGHPLIDGDLLICLVGGDGSTFVAFHKTNGKEVWKALASPEPGYAPPMIYDIGGTRQLIAWHPTGVFGLNPQTGEQYWGHRFPAKGQLQAGLSVPSPVYDPQNRWLFVTAFYDGALMLEVNKDGTGVRELWKSTRKTVDPDLTDGLHSIMPTPHIRNGYVYGVCSYGELRCLDGRTGKRLWMTRQPTTTDGKPLRWGNAFLIAHHEKYFLFNEQGDLIIANLSPKGYQERSRVNLLPPTNSMARGFGGKNRLVLWSHPAFANGHIYARNDNEIVCVSLRAADYR